MKQVLLIFCIWLGVHFVQAQDKFMVTKVGGECWHNNTKLVVGSTLAIASGDKIYVGSSLILRHLATGGTINIPAGGEFSAKSLVDELSKTQASTGDKLVSYVVGQLTQDNTDINQNHRSYMRVTGSVERASNIANVVGIEFLLDQNKYKVYETQNVYVSWQPTDGATGYAVKLKNDFGDVVQEVKTSDNYIFFNIDPAKYDKSSVNVEISLADNPQFVSNQLNIAKVDANKLGAIEKDYKSYMAMNGISEVKNAGDKITEALFFEQVGLFADALKCYRQAIDMAETDEEKKGFTAIYNQFVNGVVQDVAASAKEKK